MIRFDLDTAAGITGGRLHLPPSSGHAAAFSGLTQDTRNLRRGSLYAALVGQRVDGHRFVLDAAAKGAAAALVMRVVDAPVAQIVVEDVVKAMGALAGAWRRKLEVRLVGVTGSNGKTTVKTMLAAILRRCAPTLATRGNYNNEIGVPLTLAALGEQHRFAVVEMGCGRPGDIEYLASMARPDVGLVTNAGPAHLERLGSIDGVARTKGELFGSLGPGDTAVINRDDAYFDYWQGLCPDSRQITFGQSDQAAVRLIYEGDREIIATPSGSFGLELALSGQHNRINALAATAAALALDVELDTIAAALAAVESLPGRLSEREMRGGWRLIDDSYNANPASLHAGLEVLASRAGKRWLALGEMAELGEYSDRLHRELGRAARDLGVERLFAIGAHAESLAEAFGPGAEAFGDMNAMARRMEDLLESDVVCLVKGSRSSHMEQLVDLLQAAGSRSC
ncbi:MAG: UDP-N-acetylmuramoyl-tripeptide--D-alanyl-D-alanine ligase [Wenzhouxiangellaceae bacterium]